MLRFAQLQSNQAMDTKLRRLLRPTTKTSSLFPEWYTESRSQICPVRQPSAPSAFAKPVDLAAVLSQLLLPALRLDLFPKLSIDIHILVLEADTDAAVLSSGLTAACAAVADAGIPLTGLVVGSLVSYSRRDAGAREAHEPQYDWGEHLGQCLRGEVEAFV
ncbi:putative exosome complex exonuclease 1 [Trichosporon asahii var. asahii CBS 8904]|uniref:Putative exosome complex exonuclease 1 n=2 Tax=Trichosporon asahii var. asahii TaxID=189963 RepID=K1VM87_TRIAC|nr:putative exosome complex exonuclease 1 [Trichosporon asahii var. asahii CBS 2479]EJT50668.1 putative exosome complex exonuclease 1 [Trichosporon asahii var. asahii CBS 2479]EKD01831.1 putative exosome complex exonuclease 1 [Trichosporon asahii var. asahii CBS 8904]